MGKNNKIHQLLIKTFNQKPQSILVPGYISQCKHSVQGVE